MPQSSLTPQENAEYLDYLKTQGLNGQEANEYMQYASGSEAQPAPSGGRGEAMSMAANAIFNNPIVQGGLKAIDYPRGVLQSAATDAALTAQGKESDLLKKALAANQPSGAELLEKLGVGELGSLSKLLPQAFSKTGEGLPLKKGGMFDLTGRGALGLGTEIFGDPLTYAPIIGPLLQGAKQAGRAAKFTSKGIKGVGKLLYELPFKEADRVAKDAGFRPLTSLLKEMGHPTLGTRTGMSTLNSKAKDLINRQARIVELVEHKQVPIDVNRAIRPGEDKINKMLKSSFPPERKAAENFIPFVEEMKSTAERAGRPKTVVRKDLRYGEITQPGFPTTEIPILRGQEATGHPPQFKGMEKYGYDQKLVITPEVIKGRPDTYVAISPTQISEKVLPKVTPRGRQTMNNLMSTKTKLSKMADYSGNILSPGANAFDEEIFKTLAKGIQSETERAAQKIGKYSELKKVNSDLGTIYNSAEYVDKNLAKELRRSPITRVDAMAFAGKPAIAAAKKIADIGLTTAAQTYGGRKLINLGGRVSGAEDIIGKGAAKGVGALTGSPTKVGLQKLLQRLQDEDKK